MTDGKIQIRLGEPAVTFRWEVGLALGFVGPVYHQVPVAAETVGDFIYKRKKKKYKMLFLTEFQHALTAAHVICIRRAPCRGTLGAEARAQGFYFLTCSCCSVVAVELNRNTSRAHPVCTRAVETHEFFNLLRARTVHRFKLYACFFDRVDTYES